MFGIGRQNGGLAGFIVRGCADNHAFHRAYGKLAIIFAFSECLMMTINNNMGLTVLDLFMYICLLQVWPSSSRFAFEFQLIRVDVLNDENCDDFTVG